MSKKRVHACCEWFTYDSELNSKSIRCINPGKKYKRKDGALFTTIYKGQLVTNSQDTIRLCTEHYAEMKKIVPDLEEVVNGQH